MLFFFFKVVLGLHCWAWGVLCVAVHGVLTEVVSLVMSTGSTVVGHRLSCSKACGIFPDQGLNPCLLHWQADSLPLSHQGSPHEVLIYRGDIVTTGKASATEGRIYHLHFLRGQGTPCHAGPHGEAQGLLRRQKQERGKPSQSLCL